MLFSIKYFGLLGIVINFAPKITGLNGHTMKNFS